MSQTHKKFKLFIGTPGQDGTPGALTTAVETFVREQGVAPKSIGAEFLERTGQVILTLGYCDDEPAVPVRLHAVGIGSIKEEGDLAGLEAAMGRAAAAERDIICHELYVTDKDELFMIFMTAMTTSQS